MKKNKFFKLLIASIFLFYILILSPYLIKQLIDYVQQSTIPRFFAIVLTILGVISLPLNFFSLYALVFNFLGFVKPKREYEIYKPYNKFAILVFAHNEENVIKSSVESILSVNYPKDLYRIYVVADNCTDKTIEICEGIVQKNENVRIIKRVNDELRGKQYAVSDVLNEILPEYEKEFKSDAILFLDADNHINEEFLNEMNSDFISNPKYSILQGYLGVKNPDSNYVARGYAATYNVFNRFYQQGKRNYGINSHIGGTGFAIRTEMIYKYYWETNSLTEDYEMAVKFTCAGEKIMWNHFAIVYDEKPTQMKAATVQRLRWVRGHWQVVFQNLGLIVRSGRKMGAVNYIDQLYVALSLGKSINYLMALIIGIILSVVTSTVGYVLIPAILLLLTHVLLTFQLYTVFRHEKGEKVLSSIGKVITYTFAYIWYNVTFVPLHVIGLITWRKKLWVRTEHSINDVTDENF